MHILKKITEKKKRESIKSEPDQCYQKSKLTAGSPASHYLGLWKGPVLCALLCHPLSELFTGHFSRILPFQQMTDKR